MNATRRTGHPSPSARGSRTLIPVADVTNAFASAFSAAVIALVAAYSFMPPIREWLAAPGGLVVWATAATLVMAIGTGVWAYRRSTTDSRFGLLLPSAATVLLLQQLRFGADLLDYPLPTWAGVEVGSLIDLRRVVSVVAERLGLGVTTGILVLVVWAGATAAAAHWARRWATQRVLVAETSVVVWFVAGLGSAAAVPIFGIFGDGTGAWLASTMAGLVSAGLLVVAGLTAGDHRRTMAGWRRRIWPWIADEGPLAGIPSDL